MTLRVCSQPDCPALQPETYCLEHRRVREQQRGTRQERGYDARHDQLRRIWQARMDKGEQVVCWRCREAGRPHVVDPQRWDLGHDDTTGRHRGPECVAGNRATAGR